jgi:hypothetical protein
MRLLDKGGNPNAELRLDHTALIYASTKGHYEALA